MSNPWSPCGACGSATSIPRSNPASSSSSARSGSPTKSTGSLSLIHLSQQSDIRRQQYEPSPQHEVSVARGRVPGMEGATVGFRYMTDDEMAEYLAQPLIAVLAINEPDWPPHVAPVWFHHVASENKFQVMTPATSKKARLYREGAGTLSLCVQTAEASTAKYVNVQGTATLHPLPPSVLQTVVAKYLPPADRAAYVANPPEDSVFDITPLRIVTGVID